MMRRLSLMGLLPLLMLTTPASALTTDQKMDTCKFGADAQNLTGAKRKTFIRLCMAEEKPKKVAKAPVAKRNATAVPADPPAEQ
jgi:psiF repeat-containing protein